MAEENDILETETQEDLTDIDPTLESTEDEPKETKLTDEDVTALANRLANEKVQKMKATLNNLDQQKKELVKKVAELKELNRKAEQRKIEEDGRVSEEMQQEITQLSARNKNLEDELADMQCHMLIEEALSGLPWPFNSSNAKNMAMRELREKAKKNHDTGMWTTESGVALDDFIKETYARDPGNAYLFKRKENKGAGSPDPNAPATPFNPDTTRLLDEKGVPRFSNEELIRMFGEAS